MVEKGVKQGVPFSSPSLFLLIIDPLLTRLQNSGLGLSYSIDYVTGYVSSMLQNSGLGLSLYAGGFIHADDLRTLSLPALNPLRTRFLLLKIFSKENLSKLNVQKCEIVHFGLATLSLHQESVNSHIPTKSAAKCLGYWWSRDLLLNHSVEVNIEEGPRMFFQVRYSRVIPGRHQPSLYEICD